MYARYTFIHAVGVYRVSIVLYFHGGEETKGRYIGEKREIANDTFAAKLKTTHRFTGRQAGRWAARWLEVRRHSFWFVSRDTFHKNGSAPTESRPRILHRQRTLPRVSIQSNGYIGSGEKNSFFPRLPTPPPPPSSPSHAHKTVNSLLVSVLVAPYLSIYSLLSLSLACRPSSPFPAQT